MAREDVASAEGNVRRNLTAGGRARREFGQDPDTAKVRPPSVVERYEQ
jgi:hypothetical protein